MNSRNPQFLTADWRYLAMLNYEVDPAVLTPFVPQGTELDQWNGKAFISVVGFLFQNTKIRGFSIPFHCHFEELNLRFYVKCSSNNEWRRGVVFIKELVPRWAIAWTARTIYNENYMSLPMGHIILVDHGGLLTGVSYEWMLKGKKNCLELVVKGAGGSSPKWLRRRVYHRTLLGYARQRDGGTLEYQVEHPKWQVWPVQSNRLDCDVGALYGNVFVRYLDKAPTSAFLADGSAVTVLKGRRIA